MLTDYCLKQDKELTVKLILYSRNFIIILKNLNKSSIK